MWLSFSAVGRARGRRRLLGFRIVVGRARGRRRLLGSKIVEVPLGFNEEPGTEKIDGLHECGCPSRPLAGPGTEKLVSTPDCGCTFHPPFSVPMPTKTRIPLPCSVFITMTLHFSVK